MNLTQIINADVKAMDNDAKLVAISAKVDSARTAYGNEEVEITSPEVSTCEGVVGIEFLSSADKVALAGQEIACIRMKAIESVKCTEGRVLDREIERLLAVNSTLCNLAATSDSEYI